MVASSIFFLDSQGKPLLFRDYRGDIPLSMVDHFPRLLNEAGEGAAPCLTYEGVSVSFLTIVRFKQFSLVPYRAKSIPTDTSTCTSRMKTSICWH
jgi:hypothetical protein